MQQAKKMDNEQEKGNTVQFIHPTSESFVTLLDKFEASMDEVLDNFWGSNGEAVLGTLKVTIEFYPDTEDEVEDET